MNHLKVVAAIIEHDSRILCVQRADNADDCISGKWEFPGGKIEPDEHPEAALTREIMEELNIDLTITRQFMTNTHDYPGFTIELTSYLCTTSTITPLTLNVHAAAKWLTPNDLSHLDWAEADLPIITRLISQPETTPAK